MNKLFSASKLNAHIIEVISSLVNISNQVHAFLNNDEESLPQIDELQSAVDAYNEGSNKIAYSLESLIKMASGEDEADVELEPSDNGFKI